ncbi:hypothetical protein VHA_002524 [Grimontia hollisae CIP 101886]|uniref:Uncharacterized protein n=1 Tax=Grimontia hollisae CIP 101886 TaxID=675812 RepID=D0I9I7_GRIHO|nr:hypothetical protein VHA_002524 [Grimontia hollisae CIP 101886]
MVTCREMCQAVRALCILHQGNTHRGIITISMGEVICSPAP